MHDDTSAYVNNRFDNLENETKRIDKKIDDERDERLR